MRERIETFEVGSTPTVEVRIASGYIHVEKGAAGTVSVSISASNPDKLLVEQFKNHIQIGEEGRLRGSYRVRLEVPAGTDLNTAVASGNVDVRCPVGDLTAKSASGDVSIQRVQGRLEVKMASGDVTIAEAGGDTRVVTASGDIRVERALSDCSAATASGDIHIGTIHGSCNVKTAAGNVLVERFEGDDLSARTVSGKLDLRFPTGCRVELDVSTLSGRVDLPSPGETPAPSATPDRDVQVRAKSVSGNIVIGRAAPQPPPS